MWVKERFNGVSHRAGGVTHQVHVTWDESHTHREPLSGARQVYLFNCHRSLPTLLNSTLPAYIHALDRPMSSTCNDVVAVLFCSVVHTPRVDRPMNILSPCGTRPPA